MGTTTTTTTTTITTMPSSTSTTSDLKNKVVVITGATSGIGAATALHLAKRGTSLVLAGRRQDRGEDVVKAALAAGAHDAIFVKTDVSVASDVENLFAKAQEHFGGVDVVFSNAGALVQDNFLDAQGDDAGLATMVAVNIIGTTLVAREGAKALRADGKKGGALIFTSSIVASAAVGGFNMFGAGHGIGTYSATKAYVDGLARSLTAVEGVRIYNIAPAVYATEMSGEQANVFASVAHSVLKGVPGKPDELARVVEAIVDETTVWPSGSLIATEGPFTYDGRLRYEQVYDPAVQGNPVLNVTPEQLRDAAGRDARLTQADVDKIIAETNAARPIKSQ